MELTTDELRLNLGCLTLLNVRYTSNDKIWYEIKALMDKINDEINKREEKENV